MAEDSTDANSSSRSTGLFQLTQDAEIQAHMALVGEHGTAHSNTKFLDTARFEELKTTPLFSSKVRAAIRNDRLDLSAVVENGVDSIFPQYGLIGMRLATYGSTVDGGYGVTEHSSEPAHNLLYANVTAPWSMFICGSQGSGKSHTLSCVLENSLLCPSTCGVLTSPLTGIVLHYDNFTGIETGQLCEAAYLCSAKIPVRVLVSPSNYSHMQALYSNLPGLPNGTPPPPVYPMRFLQEHLSAGVMKTLMAAGNGDGHIPLYMEVVTKILREMVQESSSRRGLDLGDFENRLSGEELAKGQLGPLRMRLRLLESFLEKRQSGLRRRPAEPLVRREHDVWDFKKGSLTIVDLSCPFVDESDACTLFNICLGIFMKGRNSGGRIVALDEAHKFLAPNSREAANLTDTMLSLIRQQRHLATRVVIATQEPTLSPSLLDLCNVTIVHRFHSPAWFRALEGHLGGAVIGVSGSERPKYSSENLFSRIVQLRTGEALVFCPSAILDTVPGPSSESREPTTRETEGKSSGLELTEELLSSSYLQVKELGPRYIRMKIRMRITADGGQSILAE